MTRTLLKTLTFQRSCSSAYKNTLRKHRDVQGAVQRSRKTHKEEKALKTENFIKIQSRGKKKEKRDLDCNINMICIRPRQKKKIAIFYYNQKSVGTVDIIKTFKKVSEALETKSEN